MATLSSPSDSSPSPARRLLGRDWFWVPAILVLAFGLALASLGRGNGTLIMNHDLGAALSLGCGHAFRDFATAQPVAELGAFIGRQADSLSCAHAFADAHWSGRMSLDQSVHRFLLGLVGEYWRMTGGPSWSRLVPLFGAMFALSGLAGYLALRTVSMPLVAGPLGLLFATSPLQLGNLWYLRDFSKAPFIIAGVAVILAMIRHPGGTVRPLALAVTGGLICGLGLGFRSDVFILVPAMLLVMATVPQGGRPWLMRVLMVGAFLAAYLPLALPIHLSYASGNNLFMMAIHGLSDPFWGQLGLTNPGYSFNPIYDDGYAAALVENYATLVRGHEGAVVLATPEMASFSRLYYLDVVRWFPGDILTQAISALASIIRLPAWAAFHGLYRSAGLDWAPLVWADKARWALMLVLGNLGLVAVPVLLAHVMALSRGRGLLLAGLLLYFCGYVIVQFDPRHFFHLEIIFWIAAAVVVPSLARRLPEAVMEWRRRGLIGAVALSSRSQAMPVMRLLAGLTAALVVGRLVAGTVQDERLRALFTVLDGVTGEARPVRIEPRRPGAVLVGMASTSSPRRHEQLAVRFQGCGHQSIETRLIYRAPGADVDAYAVQVPVRLHGGAGTLYFPAFHAQVGFIGLEVPEAVGSCVVAASAVSGLLPVPLHLSLPDGWRDQPLPRFAMSLVRPAPLDTLRLPD